MTSRLSVVAHYIISAVPPEQLGAVKLAKALWFADVQCYRATGNTLTLDDNYERQANGPLHAQFYKTIDYLEATGAIAKRFVPTAAGTRHEYVCLRVPDMGEFSEQELATLRLAIEQCRGLTAQQASDLSHDVVWECAAPRERIPVAASAVQFGDVSSDDIAWAKSIFDEHLSAV